MKILTPNKVDSFFQLLTQKWDVRLPIVLTDGTRVISSLGDGSIALHGGAVSSKPTAAFFPQHSSVFISVNGLIQEQTTPGLPIFVLGFTDRDLECLRFIDRFFANGLRDDIYFTLRSNAVVAGISGYCGVNGALLQPSSGNCDLEFFWDGCRWLIIPYSGAGNEIVADLPDSAPPEAIEAFKKASTALPDENEKILRQASELLRADRVPDSFWSEIGDRCISCTGCNLACPTCTCFGVQDWRSSKTIERSRMWDSCQLDGFMREASGHNPLGTEALRTRRRIHHKLAADPEKWGDISCFLCGRCDKACPTGIGILAVAKELVARFA